MAESAKSDEELVALSLKEPDPFGILVSRYEKRLRRYIRYLTSLDPMEVDDVLQEVFIKIYKNLNDFDPDLRFSSWAYRIAHNEAVNHLRKWKSHPPLPLENEEGGETNWISVLQADIDLEKGYAGEEKKALVQKTLALLPGPFREALVLRYLEDLDYKAMGDILKVPVGTIGTLLNRAKKQFKAIAERNRLLSP